MAKYHYNPDTGEVGICRADPSKPNSRGCKFQLSENEHFGSREEASRGYEASQELLPNASRKQTASSGSSKLPEIASNGKTLTAEQREYFAESKVVDSEGKLLAVYHGSASDFDSFDPERLGKGNDTWGNGFYFTDSESTAAGYSEGNAPREFYLNLTNPIVIDGKQETSMQNYAFTPKQAANILKAHPGIHIQPDDEDEMNPLGDYDETFWEREHHTPKQIEEIADRVAREHFQDTGWIEMEVFFGKEHAKDFLAAVEKETGHDGVMVDFGEDGKFAVSWKPSQMKLSSNAAPTDSSRVDS